MEEEIIEKDDEDTSNILENIQKQRSSRKIKTRLSIAIVIIIVGIIAVLAFSFYVYKYAKSPEVNLQIGANLEKVTFTGNNAYIKLKAGTNIYNISKVRFIFTDNDGQEHYYETTNGINEIEVPYSRTFWDLILGFFGKAPDYSGVYDYDVSSDEIGISDFYNINEIGVSFEYVTELGIPANTTTLDTKKIVNKTTTGGGGGGGDGGNEGCTDTCNSLGYECGVHNICGSNVDCGECVECTEDSDCEAGYNCVNNKCEFNCSVGINCFYVNVTSSINATGSLGNPFNLSQAQAYANFHLNEEITFLMNGGDYGAFKHNSGNRTAWVTWKANGNVNFTYIELGDSQGPYDKYTIFDGVSVINATSRGGNVYGIWIYKSNHVRLNNIIVYGKGYIAGDPELGDSGAAITFEDGNNVTSSVP